MHIETWEIGGRLRYLLTGKLRPDEWDTFIYSPIYTLLQIPWFSVFGIGLRQINGFAACWSIVTMGLFVWLFRAHGLIPAVVASLVVALDYLMIQLGRVGLVENLVIPLMLGALLCLQSHRRAPGWTVLCGFLMVLSIITKPIAPYFPVALCMGVVFKAWQEAPPSGREIGRSIGRSTLLFMAGCLGALLPWLLLYRIPNAAAISAFGGEWMSRTLPHSPMELVNALVRTHFFHNISQVQNLWVFSMIALCAVATILFTHPRRLHPEAFVMAAWLAGGMLFVSMLESHPTRYIYPILPALYGLFVYGVVLLLRSPVLDLHARQLIGVLDLLAIAALTLVTRYYVIYRISIEAITPDDWNRYWARLFISFLLATGCWTLFRITFGLALKSRLPLPLMVRYLGIALVSLYFIKQSVLEAKIWWDSREHTIVETSRTLGERYPGMIIGGTSACAAVVENDAIAVRVSRPGFCNYEKPFERFGITHTFITDYGGEEKRFKRLYPEAMADSTLVDKFVVCGYTFMVYQRNHYRRESNE
jgi:hypothetical protein